MSVSADTVILRHRPRNRPRSVTSIGLEYAYRCAVELSDMFESRQGMAKVMLGGNGGAAGTNDWSFVFVDPFFESMMGWRGKPADAQSQEKAKLPWVRAGVGEMKDLVSRKVDTKNEIEARMMPWQDEDKASSDSTRWRGEHRSSESSESKCKEEKYEGEDKHMLGMGQVGEEGWDGSSSGFDASSEIASLVGGDSSARNTMEYTKGTSQAYGLGGRRFMASAEQLAMDADGQLKIQEALKSVMASIKGGAETRQGGRQMKEVCVWMRVANGRRARVRIQLQPALYPAPVEGKHEWEEDPHLIPVILWHQHEVPAVSLSTEAGM